MAASSVMPGLCSVGSGAGCALCRAHGTLSSWEPSGCVRIVQVVVLEAYVCAGCMKGHCPQGSLSSAPQKRAEVKDAAPEKQVR